MSPTKSVAAFVEWLEKQVGKNQPTEEQLAIEFSAARAELLAILALLARDGGFIEAPEFRPRVLGYRVSRRAFQRRVMLGDRLPLGWTFIHSRWSSCVQIGPWWLLGPGIFGRWFYFEFCELAIRVGMAEAPYEACYLHELRWFPDAPRFE